MLSWYDGKFIGQTEKWTDKETDEQCVDDSFTQSTTCHSLCLYHFFKLLGRVVPEKSLTKISIVIPLEWGTEKEKTIEKEGKINLGTLFFFSLIQLVVLNVYTSTHRCWTDYDGKILERKKNGQIKWLINHMWLIIEYTVQLVKPVFVPNFKILGTVVPLREIFDEKKG